MHALDPSSTLATGVKRRLGDALFLQPGQGVANLRTTQLNTTPVAPYELSLPRHCWTGLADEWRPDGLYVR